jgi:protein ImuA
MGFPRWEVELLKVRNGKPGKWLVQWGPQGMEYMAESLTPAKTYVRKTA